MLKDAILISVIATLVNYLFKTSEIYIDIFIYGLDNDLSVPQIESTMMFLITFVSVIISKLLLFGLKKLF
jgi:hypothetical protein